MRLMYNILLFAIAVNSAIWLVQIFGLTPFSLPAEMNPFDLKEIFTFSNLVSNFMYTGVAVVAGLATLLLRQNTFALYAMVIFVVSLWIPIVSSFVLAIPNMINSVMSLYPALNPWAGDSGVFAGTNPFSLLLVGFGTFAGFVFLVGQVSGKDIA